MSVQGPPADPEEHYDYYDILDALSIGLPPTVMCHGCGSEIIVS